MSMSNSSTISEHWKTKDIHTNQSSFTSTVVIEDSINDQEMLSEHSIISEQFQKQMHSSNSLTISQLIQMQQDSEEVEFVDANNIFDKQLWFICAETY